MTNKNVNDLENLLFNNFNIKINPFNVSNFKDNFKFYHVEFDRKILEKDFELGILHEKHIFVIDFKQQKAYWVFGNVLMREDIFDFIHASEIKKTDLLELCKNEYINSFLNKQTFKLYLKYIHNNKFTMNLLSVNKLVANDVCNLSEKVRLLVALFLLNNLPLKSEKKKNVEMLKDIERALKPCVFVKNLYDGNMRIFPYGNLVMLELKIKSPELENIFEIFNLPNKDSFIGIELSRNQIYWLNEPKETNLFALSASSSAMIEIDKIELYPNEFINVTNFREISRKLKRCKKYLLNLEDLVYGKLKFHITSIVCDF